MLSYEDSINFKGKELYRVQKKAIIIGAGIGGLATAIHLRLEGLDVSVYERLETPGGRCNQIILDGFKFDMGPTLLMMIDELEALFKKAGRSLEDSLDLIKLNPHSCFKFETGESIRFSDDLEFTRSEFERIEKGAAKSLDRWVIDNKALFEVGMSDFINRNKPKFTSALKPTNMAFFLKGQVTAPLYTTLNKYFKDEKIKNAIAFSALYLGMNPYKTPSIYSVLPYAELAGGLFFPKGGMFEIAKALEKLALDLGVSINYKSEVERLSTRDNQITSLILKNGDSIEGDVFVSNADLPVTYKNILKEKHPSQDSFKFSCSTYLIYLGLKNVPEDTHHHQCFFPSSFQSAMADLFEKNIVPNNPVFYTCCPSISDKNMAPEGMHSFTVLVPVPNGSSIDWQSEKLVLRKKVFATLVQHGFKQEDIVVEKIFTPEDLGSKFNLLNNAAFGLSHNLMQMGPFRPKNNHSKYRNLYFVGASTHPGNGIPMVLKSGALTARKVVEDKSRLGI